MCLLYTTNFVTLEEVKNYKSYQYFTGGWVLDVGWRHYNKFQCILVFGKVRHSYSSKTPLRPWLIMKSSVCGHCTCMAGQGETCSHVGARLYWLETRVCIRVQTTCTSMKNRWIVPTAAKDNQYSMLDALRPKKDGSVCV